MMNDIVKEIGAVRGMVQAYIDTAAEAPHYGRQFFGPADDSLGFACAWLHHQNLNPHHWEYWIARSAHTRGGYEDNDPLPMPEPYIREMVADWLGAARAYEGKYPETLEGWNWLRENWNKIQMHYQSRRILMNVLNEYFPNAQWTELKD